MTLPTLPDIRVWQASRGDIPPSPVSKPVIGCSTGVYVRERIAMQTAGFAAFVLRVHGALPYVPERFLWRAQWDRTLERIGFDSIGLVELQLAVEECFGITLTCEWLTEKRTFGEVYCQTVV